MAQGYEALREAPAHDNRVPSNGEMIDSRTFADQLKAAGPAMLAVTAMRAGIKEHIGSAFLLNAAEGLIAITAAHVLRSESGVEFWGPSGRVPLASHAVCEVDGGSTPSRADVAWVHLGLNEGKELGAVGLPFSDAALHAPNPGETTAMLGLPVSKSGQPRTTLSGRMLFGTGEVLASAALPGTCDPAIHVAVSFNRKHVQDLSGHEMTAPSPKGMSGGPVLILHEVAGQVRVSPIGVVIEYHEKRREKCFVMTPLARVFDSSTERICR